MSSRGVAPVVLIIEDEGPIRSVLRAALLRAGHAVVEAASATEGERLARSHNPEVVLLDLGLPDRDGLGVIGALRTWSEAPILVLSAREHPADKVGALDGGADDYITKPFGPEELLARIRAALRHAARRKQARQQARFEVGELAIDLDRRQVFRSGVEVELSPLHYRLLLTLVQNAGRVVSHEELLRQVWGPQHGTSHHLRVYVTALRRRLGDDPTRPRYILTESGIGYRFATD
jgi:two-component system KDP operon response regulator KdpE